MAVSVSTVPQPLWEPLRSFQRIYWQPRIDRNYCGNNPCIFLRPCLCAASMQRIPGWADEMGCR